MASRMACPRQGRSRQASSITAEEGMPIATHSTGKKDTSEITSHFAARGYQEPNNRREPGRSGNILGTGPATRNGDTGPPQAITHQGITRRSKKVQNNEGFGKIIHGQWPTSKQCYHQRIARTNHKKNNCVGGDQGAIVGITRVIPRLGHSIVSRRYNRH